MTIAHIIFAILGLALGVGGAYALFSDRLSKYKQDAANWYKKSEAWRAYNNIKHEGILEYEDFGKLNVEEIFSEWSKKYIVPGMTWEKEILPKLRAAMDETLPPIVRKFHFNHLPYSIIEILKDLKRPK